MNYHLYKLLVILFLFFGCSLTVPKIDHTLYLDKHSYIPTNINEIVGKYEWSSGLGGSDLYLSDDNSFRYRDWFDLYTPGTPLIWLVGNYFLHHDSLLFLFNGYDYQYSDTLKNKTVLFKDLNSIEKKNLLDASSRFSPLYIIKVENNTFLIPNWQMNITKYSYLSTDELFSIDTLKYGKNAGNTYGEFLMSKVHNVNND